MPAPPWRGPVGDTVVTLAWAGCLLRTALCMMGLFEGFSGARAGAGILGAFVIAFAIDRLMRRAGGA